MKEISRQIGQLIIGVPSKGRLKEHVLEYLAEHDMKVLIENERHLQADVLRFDHYKVVFIHPKDIPIFLEKGVIDVGFTGIDLIHETQADVRAVVKIGRGFVKMSLMVPEYKDYYHPFHLLDKTVATPFPNICREYFEQLNVRVHIQTIMGASEGMPYLGLVDGIVDVVETGTSARENGLKIIADNLFDSECVACVHKPHLQENYRIINEFLRRIY